MSFVDPGAATDASAAGGKGGGAGGGDPFAAFSGLGGGLGDVLGGGLGLGGVDSSATPGGNISDVANAQGDPTGAIQAQQSIQAGAPSPGTPGGGIGGAQSGQSGATQPFNPAVGFSQQPAEATTPAGYKPGPTTGQPMDPTTQPDQSVPKSTSQDSGNLTQSQFDQRFQDPSFAQRFGTNNMAPGGNMAPTLPQLSQTQLAQAGMNMPEAQLGPGGFPATAATGTPNVDTPTAGPATPTTTGAGTPAATPGAAPDTTDTTGSKPAGTKPAAAGADTTDASSGADRQAGGGQGGGRGGIPGMPNINPIALISALLRGGPRAALGELARQAMGQGMMQPNMPGAGAPGRGYSPGGTGRDGTDEGPEAPDTAQQPLTPEQQQQQQAAAAGRPAPGVAPTSTGFAEGGQPGQPGPTGALPAPPAWATAAAGAGGAGTPNTTASQNASLGGGNLPATGNAQVDRWVSPQHVQMSRLAGTNTPPTPGYSSTMRDARAPYMDQITPHDRTLLYGMMNAENAKDPIGPMESLANRAVSNHMSIHQLLNSGFYGPRASFLRRGLAIQNSGQAGHYDSVINAVRRGSNVLGGATDQGSGRDPNVGWRGGRVLRSGEVYNDWGGGRGHNANRTWREQIQARVRQENAANPPRPPAPIPNVNRAQRVGEGSPIESFGAGSMGQGNIAQNWRRSSNVENVNAPTFDQRFQGDVDPAEARVRKANYEASLPGYVAPPSQLANALGLGDIRLDQITQLLSQLQASPPQ